MKKKIVLINGSGGVGKDTFVGLCDNYVKVSNISTVDKVKEAAALLGWDGGKTEKDRLFLSNLKLMAVEYSDHSYEYIQKSIWYFMKLDKKSQILFIHIREPKEIERVADDFNCVTLLIKNKNVAGISSNISDANVESFTYDYIINNDEGFKELAYKARVFVDGLLSETSQILEVL